MNQIFCQKYQRDLPAMLKPPMPGDLGLQLQQQYSQQAWDEWLKLQTMLINEKQLSLIDPAARKYLSSQREKFLSNQQYDEPAGYVAPEN